MKKRINCWEFMRCGRSKSGDKADLLGVCPAATVENFDGTHGGKNGGRVCWMVAGTMCEGSVQGTFAVKFKSCRSCEFFGKVKAEEGENFMANAAKLLKHI